MRKRIALGLACALLLGACSKSAEPAASATPEPTVAMVATETPVATTTLMASETPVASATAMTPKVYKLAEIDKSGQTGTMTLTATKDGKTKVVLALTGGKFTEAQPAHIHEGSCPTPGAVKYPLTNVVNGKSETTLAVTLEDLLAMPTLAVNVHKSAAEVKTYTSCGDLK